VFSSSPFANDDEKEKEMTPDIRPLETMFAWAGRLVAIAWIVLAATPPRALWAPRVWQITGQAVPALLAVAYVVLIARHWGPGGFSSLADVTRLFNAPGLLLAGWFHYLAFDLFVGTWMAQRSVGDGLPRWWLVPILLLTFLFGPAGLLAYLVSRSLRAGRVGVAVAAEPMKELP
jgi:hypothetical protein